MTTMQNKPHMPDRRKFFHDCLRYGGLLSIGGVASVLGWRSLHGDCVRTNPCGACPLLSGCDLPKAVDSKKSTQNPAPDHG